MPVIYSLAFFVFDFCETENGPESWGKMAKSNPFSQIQFECREIGFLAKTSRSFLYVFQVQFSVR